ncbi:MAG TPA: hypothetical protein VL172_03570, partial [Kofleriaceae bacterium]|nr:hypothetical protein [Kofleriaceae bacterium]
YLRGRKSVPLCSSVRKPYGYVGQFSAAVQCRSATCGDGLCESDGGESCSACAQDCGACP